MVMDMQIRDHLVFDGVQQCKKILEEKEKIGDLSSAMLPDGKIFFNGCIEGFNLSRTLVCLEQFEQFIISMKTREERERQASDYKIYLTNLGKRCSLEFIYNSLSSIK